MVLEAPALALSIDGLARNPETAGRLRPVSIARFQHSENVSLFDHGEALDLERAWRCVQGAFEVTMDQGPLDCVAQLHDVARPAV